jgi:uncharacterized damage-inducible protein DinB
VVPPGTPTEAVVDDYRRATEESDAAIRQVGDPATMTARMVGDAPQSLRWVLAHFMTETTRHAGHADILRELIDGTTGR